MTKAAESGHWYDLQGNPQYTLIGKNGKERNTTLRDARELNYVPSVTTITGQLDKPALVNWKIDQAIMASLTLPRLENEFEESWLERVREDAKETGINAASEGTKIHAAIQAFYEGETVNDYIVHVIAAEKALNALYGRQNWICEASFAHPLGFGGKSDLHLKPCADFPLGLVVDIKTKEFDDPSKVAGWDDQLWQVAAYREGLGIPQAPCANLWISRSVPNLAVICGKKHDIPSWTTEELDWGWACFRKLVEFWKIKNKYEVKQ